MMKLFKFIFSACNISINDNDWLIFLLSGDISYNISVYRLAFTNKLPFNNRTVAILRKISHVFEILSRLDIATYLKYKISKELDYFDVDHSSHACACNIRACYLLLWHRCGWVRASGHVPTWLSQHMGILPMHVQRWLQAGGRHTLLWRYCVASVYVLCTMVDTDWQKIVYHV